MALFNKAVNTQARLKLGMLGFAGSGKTYTSTMTMIGLVEHMRMLGLPDGNKPLYFLDMKQGLTGLPRSLPSIKSSL